MSALATEIESGSESNPTVQLPEQYRAAQALEHYLGDPQEAEHPFGFAQAVALDEREQYPEDACRLLDAWGFYDYHIPVQHGGKLRSYEELLVLLKIITRRNFTVGYGYSILKALPSTPVWVGGNNQQQRALAQLLKSGQQLALAYNERAHGSDFLASELQAQPREDGRYHLRGEKWLISNATRSAAMTVIARTNEGGGPRGFSLFFVRKDRLDAASFKYLPRLKPMGIRGVDVGGIDFDGSEIDKDSLVGSEGGALELTLKAFQITRTVIPGACLGAADTALRCTLDFALSRQLYGQSVFALPHPRHLLVNAFLDLLICDAMATVCARGLHEMTEQMRLHASAVKYFVPTMVEEMVQSLAVVLGARHYLREGHWSGIFQKLLRDITVIRYHFHAATNLSTIGLYLHDLRKYRERMQADEKLPARVSRLFDLRQRVAEFNPARLRLYTRGADHVLAALPLALNRLHQLAAQLSSDSQQSAVVEHLIRLTQQLLAQVEVADREQQAAEERLGSSYGQSVEMFEQSARYCVLHAGACCVLLWLHNREQLDEFFGRGVWVVLSLERLLKKVGVESERERGEYEQEVSEQLERMHRAEQMFALVPLRLAGMKEAVN